MAELSIYGGTITSNNLTIIKRILSRFSEKVVFSSNGNLSTGETEKIKFIINNVLNRHPFAQGVNDNNRLEECGYRVDFKPGSALYNINALIESSKEEDMNSVVDLYVNEANIFISELKDKVKPILEELLTAFDGDKDVKIRKSGSNFRLKMVSNIELFDYLEDNKKLSLVGKGEIPPTLGLGFPLDKDFLENETAMRELFITGDSTIDNLAKNLLDTLTVQDIKSFWDKYMLNIGYENSNMHNIFNLHYRKPEELVMLYLALTRILNGQVHFTTSIETLEANKVNIQDLINNIVLRFNTYVKQVKQTGLIVDYYTDDKLTTIYVVPEAYQAYLENGGSVDRLVGYTIKATEENLPKFLRADTVDTYTDLDNFYKKLVNLEKLTDYSYNLNVVSGLWKAYVAKIVNRLSTVDGRVISFDFTDKQEVIAKYIDGLKNEELFDTVKVLTNLIILVNPDVGSFINNMNSMLQVDGGKPEDIAKEASLYATVQRLADKLLDDTTTVKVG